MRKARAGSIILVAVALLAAFLVSWLADDPGDATGHQRPDSGEFLLEKAFALKRSGIQVEAEGTVIANLADDLRGSRHQRFVVRLDSGQTVLIAHNIDLAPRINDVRTGDRIVFRGEYEWNDRGGVVHWTHHDPGGGLRGGWLRHRGHLYR